MRHHLKPLLLPVLAAPLATEAAPTFAEFQPLLETYCYECHNPEKDEADLDLEALSTEALLLEDHVLLEDLQWVIEEKDMPPKKADAQPSDAEREQLVEYLEQTLLALSNAKPEDPGVVPMARINPHQFDYIVEDLTGFDLELGQYLTPDAASERGFVNGGALQTMSVGQFEGFLSTAKKLLDHARVVPGAGITWSSTPLAAADTDEQLKTALREAWIEWHEYWGQEVGDDHADAVRRETGMMFEAFLEAWWQYKHRAALGMPDATLEQIAAEYPEPLFPSLVELAGRMVEKPESIPGFLDTAESPIFAEFRRRVMAIPPPATQDRFAARDTFKQLNQWREAATSEYDYGGYVGELVLRPDNRPDNQRLRGLFHKGTPEIPVDLAKAKHGEVFLAVTPIFGSAWNPSIVFNEGSVRFKDGSEKPWTEVLEFTDANGRKVTPAADGSLSVESPGHLRFKVPDGAVSLLAKAAYAESDSDEPAAVRIGAFSEAPTDPVLSFEDCQVVGGNSPRHSSRMKREMQRLGQVDATFKPVFRRNDGGHFQGLPEEVIAWLGVEKPEHERTRNPRLFSLTPDEFRTRVDAEARANFEAMRTRLTALAAAEDMGESKLEEEIRRITTDFAARLWRRAPTTAESDGLVELYRADREAGRSFDAAAKTPLTAILISPEFLYHITTSKGSTEPYLLEETELATRLALTLWARLPDPELLRLAKAGELRDAETYHAQIRRLIDDPRAAAFIEQFTGRWLGFADFDKFSGPDAEKYPEFTPELRRAMHLEAKLFFLDLLREDRPITDALTADYTYLNERLAKHYGIDGVTGSEMRRVALDEDSRRGGVLGMGAFLTKFSQPLRTSPVHRGIWVYQDLLGLPIPEPPPNVPLLSDDETDEEGLTVAQQLEMHRDKPECSSCHEKFDPLGVALEHFDPIGRWRETTGGQPVDDNGRYKTGQSVHGVAELRSHILGQRDQFLEHFAENLLAYCLGRDLLPTDKPTVERILQTLGRHDLSFRAALVTTLTSPQFVKRRDLEE